MTPEVRARIFEPFFTTKLHSGTGLGLSMVYGFTTQSEGHIEVESEVGRGTAFHLYLPRSAGSLVPAFHHPSQAQGTTCDRDRAAGGGRAPRAQLGATHALAREGYTVLTAEGAKEALALVEQHGGRIAVVITDVLMPDMSGPELVSKLRGTCRARSSCTSRVTRTGTW
jgi:two-component system, cell cycle sensor histidine kinase and response regulator CckA